MNSSKFSARDRGYYGAYERKAKAIAKGKAPASDLYYVRGQRRGQVKDSVVKRFRAIGNTMLGIRPGRRPKASNDFREDIPPLERVTLESVAHLPQPVALIDPPDDWYDVLMAVAAEY